MKIKIAGLAVFCTILTGMTLAGCSQKNTADTRIRADEAFSEPQYDWGKSTGETLTVCGVYPDLERSYITKAFDRYRSLTGNELEIVQMPKEEFEQYMIAAVNGEAEKTDILFSYGGTNIESFLPEENFYDFTDAGWVDDLTDASINQTIYNGKVIGLPHWEASISGTLYNKEIFSRYNLEIPQTQQEFMETCAVLLENGITPMYLPGKEISMLLYQFPLDSLVEDPGVLKGLNDGSLGYSDIPEIRQIVQWYKTMADNGYFGATWQTDDWNGMNEAMESENYAMMLCWDTWLYTDFQGDASRFGLMPAFMGLPENGTFEGPNLGLFIVNKNSTKMDAALNFITFLADPYNYNAAFEGIYTAPVFKNQVASISTPQYLEAEHLIEQNYRDSLAWLRIRGFSQMDASCILDFMTAGSFQTAEDCVLQMDGLRNERLSQ